MSDQNEYTPWEQYGETELAYYKRLYLEESATAERLEIENNRLRQAECAKCGRSLPPDGDCYGCQADRLRAVVDAARKVSDHRHFRLDPPQGTAYGFIYYDLLDDALRALDGEVQP